MNQAVGNIGRVVVRQARNMAPELASAAANSGVTAAQNLLFGPIKRRSAGAQREDIRIQTASEGVGIQRVYGTQRIAGQVIWISSVSETTNVTRSSAGGKGVRRTVEEEHTEYLYSVSLAIGLGEGPVTRIVRAWADGQEIPLYKFEHRIHVGTSDQLPDPLIEAIEGSAKTPAYRGVAYIVFEDLPLARFGNRVPQFNFEVERRLPVVDPDELENAIRAVTLIPGSGESVYNTETVHVEEFEGISRPENAHSLRAASDVQASLDHLSDSLPNTKRVGLIVSWFGTDLRAGECRIEPRTEDRKKTTVPNAWVVAGRKREDVSAVSRLPDGSPAYGGTPSDAGVTQTIRDLKTRGLDVMFYPFILMDVPTDNTLPSPYGGASQAAYPWRGRIAVAPLRATDRTAGARTQINTFFSRYRQMVLHYAQLCRDAGGIETFLIGSEMRGLTQIRDDTGAFPAVDGLIALARECRSILGAETKISYAADWSEYANFRPNDDSGDVLFPLDQLWADDAIDFVGIDNYIPLTDWREGQQHLDALAGAVSIYDENYLKSGINGGEGYDWFYADDQDRVQQVRTPIIDTAHGEDWIFRVKDLWSWWSSPHHQRNGGIRNATPTAYIPKKKPIYFTELGCAATDKASNQPNIFFDPKSSESGRPYFSTGDRDDLIQRRFIEAHLSFWSDPENNPVSPLYGGSMVEIDHIYLYTWDARPFPDFPLRQDVWTDSANWTFGHWLNGRVGKISLGPLIEKIAAESGMTDVTATMVDGLVTGYSLRGPMSARDAIEPLLDFFQLDTVERAGVLVIRPRHGRPDAIRDPSFFATEDEGGFTINRAQEADLPSALSLTFVDSFSDYSAGNVHVVDPGAIPSRTAYLDTGLVMETGEAEGHAAALLAEARAIRTTVTFALGADDIQIEPSDVIAIKGAGEDMVVRVTEILDGPFRRLEAIHTDPGLFATRYGGLRGRVETPQPVPGAPLIELLDLPILPEGRDGAFLRVAAFASPWPGQVAVFRGDGQGAVRLGTISTPSIMGRLESALSPGPVARWDEGSTLLLRLSQGNLASLDRVAVLNGAGKLAVETSAGSWEIVSYQSAVLDVSGVWVLTKLLRGQRGTEQEAGTGAPVGARVVILSNGQSVVPISPDAFGVTDIWQAGPAAESPGKFPYRLKEVTLTGAGLRPFAPVHGRARQVGDMIETAWVRRTRIGGDNWATAKVPVSEAREQYRVRAFNDQGAQISDQTVDEPNASVPAKGVVLIEIAQLSDVFGLGRALRVPIVP